MLPRDEEGQEKASKAFKNALKRIAKAYAVEINSIQTERIYCNNSSQIRSFIVNNKIDLVLSPVQVTRVSDAISQFNSLVKGVPCPVLYVPELFEINRFRKIALVLDVEDKTDSLPDETLVNLLCRNDYHITFLLVFKPGTSTDRLKHALDVIYSSKMLEGISYSVHLIHEADLTSGVVSFIDEFEVDLVVTCKKKSMLDYLRLGRGFSPKAINTKVPLLSVR